MLAFKKLSLRRGGKLLISQSSCTVFPQQKVGIVGANGSGKSSLFSLVRKEIQADEGDVSLPDSLVIAYVLQQMPQGKKAAIEFVIDGDEEFRQIQSSLKQAEDDEDSERLAHLHEALNQINGYQVRSRAAILMHGLGFSSAEENQPIDRFSGGWQMRLNIAKALMCRSDLLLLDEPTNHLDLDTVIWLQGWLNKYTGTLLLISHDRDFIDGIVDHIISLEHQSLNLYSGNYSAFETQRAARLAQQQASYKKQQREIKAIHRFVDRFRAKASKARQAQSRIKALNRLELVSAAHIDSPFGFKFPACEKLPNPLINIESAEVGFGNKTVLRDLNLILAPADRIGLLGANGNGKSTLLKLIAGICPSSAGQVSLSTDTRIGYFAQHQLEQLVSKDTVLSHIQRLNTKASEQSLRNFLGGFGFIGDRVLDLVEPLSGGEKVRLVLAMLVYQKPNLLLLDEPTNHLDIEMRFALTLALQSFDGAIVLVSHDRSLLNSVTDQFVLVHSGTIQNFSGDLDDYTKWLSRKEKNVCDLGKLPNAEKSVNQKDKRRLEAQNRNKLQPQKKLLKSIEQKIKRLTADADQLDDLLSDQDLYVASNKDQLKEVIKKRRCIKDEIENNEDEWIRISEEIEVLS